MNYSSDVQNTQNTENFSYTPYMIKPSNSNSSGCISYIDLLKFGQVTDFGYLEGYSSFNNWQGFITSVHEHLRNLYARVWGETPPQPSNIPVTGISITNYIGTKNVGESGYIEYTIIPSNATNQNVIYNSSNENYLILDNTMGNSIHYSCIGGTESGSDVVITITTVDGGFSDSITIKCKDTNTPPTPVQSVSLSPSSVTINKGSRTTLTATVLPADAANKTISWSTSNSSIATVTNGSVYGVAAGTAIITVTTADGNKTATSTITVEESNPNPTDFYWYIGVTLPTTLPASVSDVQTDNTKPGWHSIGSSLSGFTHDMNNRENWVTLVEHVSSEADLIYYYVVIPDGLNFKDAVGSNLKTNGDFTKERNFSISGYEAYKSNDTTAKVRGLIFQG